MNAEFVKFCVTYRKLERFNISVTNEGNKSSKPEIETGAALTQAPTATNYDVGSATMGRP